MAKQPMHNCESNECDNRNSIDVLEVKIARIEKINSKLSKELDKAKKEIKKRDDRLEISKFLIEMFFSSKILWLVLFISFIYNITKGG